MAKICVFQIVLTCTLILIPSSIRIWAKEVIDNDIRNKRILLNSAEDIVSEIMNLKSEIEHLKKELQSNTGDPGSAYIRWGRTTCYAENELVYKGYTAGKHYAATGSGTNTLCLPDNPVWGNYTDGGDPDSVFRAGVYGAEIDTVDTDHIFPFNVNQQDMPCCVCKTARSTTLMIPARKECYPGWTKEYSGYLMADSRLHNGHDYICMDGEPEFIPHGGTNDNDHVLYLAEGKCGSLPCPPYVEGRELTCVVCSI